MLMYVCIAINDDLVAVRHVDACMYSYVCMCVCMARDYFLPNVIKKLGKRIAVTDILWPVRSALSYLYPKKCVPCQ